MTEYDLKITLHNHYIAKLWDPQVAGNDKPQRRMCGTRAASGLLSLAAFASNKKPEFRIAQGLAKRIMPTVDKMMAAADSQLSKNLREVRTQLEQTRLPDLAVALPPDHPHEFFIEPGRGAPLVAALARMFITADAITSGLKELHNRGVLSFSAYKKREQKLVAPLTKLMEEVSQLITRYHRQRKQLVSMLDDQHDESSNDDDRAAAIAEDPVATPARDKQEQVHGVAV